MGSALVLQAKRARAAWPWIDVVEADHRLPRCLLYAVGSRESSLAMIRGDSGHGHGIWQLDDRSHPIQPGFDVDPHAQSETAATMLATLLAMGEGTIAALNRYNSGRPATGTTTGGNYGPDVAARMDWLNHHFEPPFAGDLALGYRGADVATWQGQMAWRGWKVSGRPLTVDGIFGPQSRTVTVAFQRQCGLTVDGTVGPLTWAATWEAPVI